MATLKEWVLANQVILPKPPESRGLAQSIQRVEDYKKLQEVQENISNRYEHTSKIKEQLSNWTEVIFGNIRDMYSQGFEPPKPFLELYPRMRRYTVKLDTLKQLCDKHNWVIVRGNIYNGSSRDDQLYVGPPSIIELSNVTADNKPVYIGSNLEPRLAPTLMYLPMINLSSTSEARKIHQSLYNDFKQYFGCDSKYATFCCESNGNTVLFWESVFENCNFKEFEETQTVDPIEYMDKVITPVIGGYTVEGSTKIYQNMGAIKSAIRAMVKKEQS